MEIGIVVTTVSNIDDAKKIANHLVKGRFAACVNIIPSVTSVYEWQNEIVEDNECILFVKTRSENFEELKCEILSIHPYALPEIIMLPVKHGHLDYLQWVFSNTNLIKQGL